MSFVIYNVRVPSLCAFILSSMSKFGMCIVEFKKRVLKGFGVLANSWVVDKVDPVVGIFGLRPIQCLVSVHITDLVLHFSM